MNKSIFAIAGNIFTELSRHKMFNVVFVFLLIMLGTVLFITELSPGAEKRVILDIGYASIEILSLLTVGLGIALVTFEEKELRTIWLVLVKPVKRYEYCFGKYIGVGLLLTANVLAMTVILTLICLFTNVLLDFNFLFVIGFIFFKMLMMLGIALFFSIISSSLVTQITFTLFLYLLGYISHHLLPIINETRNIAAKLILKIIYLILPHFGYIDLKDYIYSMEYSVPFGFIAKVTIYVFVYSLILSILSALIFERKEFK